jgi:SAM-dependent methyltransferase
VVATQDGGVPPGVDPKFWRLVLEEPLATTCVLDVGTGSGRLALALAPLSRRVVGIDREPSLIEEASRRAAAAGLANATFLVMDADRAGYRHADDSRVPIDPGLIVAHLFLSEHLIEAAAAALPAGGALAFVGFHADQWRETGRRSRFAWDEDKVAALLAERELVTEHLEVDTEVHTFGSIQEALAAVVGLEDRWRQDGRWFRYIEYLEKGGRSLTRSHLIVKARRRR